MLVKWSRLFWIFVLSGAVLIGGAAWLSAQLAVGARRAGSEGSARGGRSRLHALPGPAPGRWRPRRRGPRTRRAVAAGNPAVPSPSPSGADVQPSIAPPAAGAPEPADAPALEAGEVAAPPRAARSKDALRVNPTSGEHDVERAGRHSRRGPSRRAPLRRERCARPGSSAAARPRAAAAHYPMAGAALPGRLPGTKGQLTPQRINSQ